jgi:hypothetical protein
MIENIDEKEEAKKNNKKLLRDALINLLSMRIYLFGMGTFTILANLLPYLLSYLRGLQGGHKTIQLHYSYYFYIVSIFFGVVQIIAPAIQNKLGLRCSVIVGTFIILPSMLLIYFSKLFILDILAYFLLTLGCFCLPLLDRNFLYYFYEVRGKIIGSFSLLNALESAGFNMFAEKFIVNPKSDEADVDELYYPVNISENIRKYILISILIFIICAIISIIFIIPFDKKIHGKGLFQTAIKGKDNSEEEDNNDNNEDDEDANKGELLNNNEDEEEIGEGDAKPPEKLKKQSFSKRFLKNALKSKRVINLFFLGIFSSPLNIILVSSWRNMAIRNGIPTSYQQNIESIRPFVECFSTLIFSSLADSIPYRYLYSILSLVSTGVGILFCFTLHSPILFSIIILIESAASRGKIALGTPHFLKVFGLKHYLEIGGFISLYIVIIMQLSQVFLLLFDSKFAKKVNEDEVKITGIFDSDNAPYFILFITCGILNGVSAFLSCFESEEMLEF